MDRRSFIEKLGGMGVAGAFLANFPWLESCSPQTNKAVAKEKTRIGLIGPGSRGCYHLEHLQSIPQAEVVALCDNYAPHLEDGASYFPQAKLYSDYRQLLEDKNVDSVVIATPLDRHYRMAMDAMDAGKHVFCEKSMSYTIEQCHDVYMKHQQTGKVFFVGQQRLFDPKYLKAMEGILEGKYGPVVNVRNYWFRNGDWRREVPSPDLERHINWRLYREYSRGLMTELACHQLQNGTWAIGQLPEKVIGSGNIIYWKDGREVFDSVCVIYTFPNGVNMTFESVISNAHFGMGEQILCKDAMIDLPGSRIYFEEPPRKSGIESLIADIEQGIFSNSAFAGTSWNAESGSKDKGIAIMPNADGDGSFEIMQAFCNSAITGKMPEAIMEEAYYASVFSILGDEAMLQGKEMRLDEKYLLPSYQGRKSSSRI
ncbi:MAG: Gfo/Idh/MocA family oxidoreductase [Bacteroidales bacterium]|nr:Gfo/Idh/MocA family oxidoreductase [Candidatus Cacconaster equifaecalis]